MSIYKKLLGQTAIYGLSSILGRLLNYFLVPLYVRIFPPDNFGIITELYAHVTLAIILFTYGMETAFFRFSSSEENKDKVFSTSMISLILSSILLSGLMIINSESIANLLEYPGKGIYIIYLALILGLDAISAIPFARLRQQGKAIKFAIVRLVNIFTNIFINIYFLVICPYLVENNLSSLAFFYDPNLGIEYIFIANLIASLTVFAFLSVELFKVKWYFDKALWKKLLIYALPLLPAGFAGMINESFSRIQLKELLPYSIEENLKILGIFGANYRLSMLMTLSIQAYRMAAEPFFFSLNKQQDSKVHYSKIMDYFVWVCGFIFLAVVLNLQWIKDIFFGNTFKEYQDGLDIIPILLYANLFLGIFYNLSIWYKLSDKTKYGAYFSIFGAIITIALNYLLIPIYGYIGAAWATFLCYFSMMIVCYLYGRKHYHIPYNIKKIISYLIIICIIYIFSNYIRAQYTHINIWTLQFIDWILLILYIILGYFSLINNKKQTLLHNEN